MDICGRLKLLREKSGQSQARFAANVDMGQNTYGQYELGKRQIPDEFKIKLTQVLHINLHWLITGEGPMYTDGKEGEVASGKETYVTPRGKEVEQSPNDPSVFVPVLASKVSAGPGEEWLPVDFREGVMVPILRRFTRAHDIKDVFAAEVKGDSMVDAQLYDGDYVFAVRGLVAGDGIYVISIAGNVYVKRIEQDLLGEKVRVISENPHYQPMELEAGQVTVLGKVIGWLHHHPY